MKIALLYVDLAWYDLKGIMYFIWHFVRGVDSLPVSYEKKRKEYLYANMPNYIILSESRMKHLLDNSV